MLYGTNTGSNSDEILHQKSVNKDMYNHCNTCSVVVDLLFYVLPILWVSVFVFVLVCITLCPF